jgi:hypothetical protein
MRSRLEVSILVAIAGALSLSAGCSSDDASEPTECTTSDALSYEGFGGPFFLNWCTGCHSSKLPEGSRQDAPVEINFDTVNDIRSHRSKIVDKAVHSHKMPPAGGPSDADRELLGQWLGCGAPALTEGFTPPEPPPVHTDPPPTGACAEPKKPLEPAMLPRCSLATSECVTNCALEEEEEYVEDCRDACLASDTTPPSATGMDCQGCVYNQILACAGEKGCQKQTAKFVCCTQSCSDEACIDDKCKEELTSFGYCIGYQAEVCYDFVGPYLGACFAK